MTTADLRAHRLDVALPLGYPKTLRFRFWTDVVLTADGTVDVDLSTPEDLSGWTAWTTLVFRPARPTIPITPDATDAATGVIEVTFPATLDVPSGSWVLAGTDPTAAPGPVLTGLFTTNLDPAGSTVPPSTSTVLVDVAVGTTSIDIIRIGGGSSASGVTDHGDLTGLTDPDHPIAAVIGLQATLDALAVADTDEATARAAGDALLIPLTLIGAVFGVAPLDASTLIPESFLPASIARDAEVTAAVDAAVAALVASAPSTLDTLDELAAALSDNPNVIADLTALIGTKVAASLYDAHTILTANTDDTPGPLPIPEDTLLGRVSGGNIAALTPAQIRSLLALGTAALLDVPAAGDAASGEVVKGDDSRLTDSRPVSVQAGGVPVAAETVLDILNSGSVTWNVLDAGSKITLQAFAAALRIGTPSIDGHSYSQLVGGHRGLQPLTFPRLLSAALSSNPADTQPWGRSGAVIAHCLDYPNAVSIGIPGWGGLLRVWHPNHRFNDYIAGVPYKDTADPKGGAWPHAGFGIYGENEAGLSSTNVLAGAGIPIAEARGPYRDGWRALLSLRRAARLFPTDHSAWAGTMAAQAVTHAPKGTYRKITADGQTAIFTIPTDASPGDILTLAFMGGPNGYTELAANMAIGATSFTIKNTWNQDVVRGQTHPTSYPFHVDIGGEVIRVTGRSGSNNSIFACDATTAAHNTNDPVRRAASTAVNLTGAVTDTIILDARGYLGSPQIVLKRITLTEAMLGQTITITSTGYKTAPFAPGVCAAWIEDRDPPPYVMIEAARQRWQSALASDAINASKLLLNADLATVAAEFTNVAVAPLETAQSARYAYTLRTGSSLNGTDAAGTSRTFDLTPDNTTLKTLKAGRRLGNRGEILLVTAVVDNGTHLTVTALRAQDSTTSAAAVAGDAFFDTFPTGDDGLHPAQAGHRLTADVCIATIAAMALSTQVQINTGTYQTIQRRYRSPEAATAGAPWHYTPAGERSTLTSQAVNKEVTYLHEIHQAVHITKLFGFWTARNAANRDFIWIIRSALAGPGVPLCIVQFTVPGGTGAYTHEATVDLMLRPGLYWWGTMSLTAASAGTHRSVKPIDTMPLSIATATPTDDSNGIWGYEIQHASATPADLPTPTGVIQNANGLPMIGYAAYAFGRD